MALKLGANYGFSGYFSGCRKFLFETIPDIFPEQQLTMNEVALWQRYEKHHNKKVEQAVKSG